MGLLISKDLLSMPQLKYIDAEAYFHYEQRDLPRPGKIKSNVAWNYVLK